MAAGKCGSLTSCPVAGRIEPTRVNRFTSSRPPALSYTFLASGMSCSHLFYFIPPSDWTLGLCCLAQRTLLLSRHRSCNGCTCHPALSHHHSATLLVLRRPLLEQVADISSRLPASVPSLQRQGAIDGYGVSERPR